MESCALLLCFILLTAVISIFSVPLNATQNHRWEQFKLQFNKGYNSSTEDNLRSTIFEENLIKINHHNVKFENGTVSFKLAVNKFADMLHSEFVATMNGFKKHTNRTLKGTTFIRRADSIPDEVNWVTQGAVTDVKEQGGCASDWAFSATGALEGQHFQATGELVSLSEQNLMDCTWNYGNKGCDGGHMDPCYQYVLDRGGIDSEQNYPYNACDQYCVYVNNM